MIYLYKSVSDIPRPTQLLHIAMKISYLHTDVMHNAILFNTNIRDVAKKGGKVFWGHSEGVKWPQIKSGRKQAPIKIKLKFYVFFFI